MLLCNVSNIWTTVLFDFLVLRWQYLVTNLCSFLGDVPSPRTECRLKHESKSCQAATVRWLCFNRGFSFFFGARDMSTDVLMVFPLDRLDLWRTRGHWITCDAGLERLALARSSCQVGGGFCLVPGRALVQAAPEPGGIWQAFQDSNPRQKACCGFHGLKPCRALAACLPGSVGTTSLQTVPLWGAGLLAFLNLPAARSVLLAANKAFPCESGSRFLFSPPSAGCGPFPRSCVGGWRVLAVLVCSQIRIFPFSLSAEV